MTPFVWTDDELERLIDNYLVAARLAQEVGFQFVDIKACHGYLLHELLSARTRRVDSVVTWPAAPASCGRSFSASVRSFPICASWFA